MAEFKIGELSVEPDSVVLAEGDASPHLYTVLDGFGVRAVSLPDGRRQVTNFIFPGDFLGLQAAMLGELNHSVIATTPMLLCVFPRDKLWDLIRSSPARGYDIVWAAAGEERFLETALLSVGRRTALEAVALGLWTLFQRASDVGRVKKNAASAPWPQRDFADALGLSLVHTNKTLKKLREAGVATWSNGLLTAPNVDMLAELAHFDPSAPRRRPLL